MLLEFSVLLLTLTITTGLLSFAFVVLKIVNRLDTLPLKEQTPVISHYNAPQEATDTITPNEESELPLTDFRPDFKKPLKLVIEDDINEK